MVFARADWQAPITAQKAPFVHNEGDLIAAVEHGAAFTADLFVGSEECWKNCRWVEPYSMLIALIKQDFGTGYD